jgi:hypothetical protein
LPVRVLGSDSAPDNDFFRDDYVVRRFLAEDAGKHVDEVLDAILSIRGHHIYVTTVDPGAYEEHTTAQ